MTVFGRMGRIFAIVGTVCAIVTVIGLFVLNGSSRIAVCVSFGVVGLIGLIHGAVWTTLQHRMFGSPAAIAHARQQPPVPARVLDIRMTSSSINHQPIPKVTMQVGTSTITRRMVVPFFRLATFRPGITIPVRLDPAGTRAAIVEWSLMGQPVA